MASLSDTLLSGSGEARQREWRGKVQHVNSGEVFYFRQWSELVTHIEEWLEQDNQFDPMLES